MFRITVIVASPTTSAPRSMTEVTSESVLSIVDRFSHFVSYHQFLWVLPAELAGWAKLVVLQASTLFIEQGVNDSCGTE